MNTARRSPARLSLSLRVVISLIGIALVCALLTTSSALVLGCAQLVALVRTSFGREYLTIEAGADPARGSAALQLTDDEAEAVAALPGVVMTSRCRIDYGVAAAVRDSSLRADIIGTDPGYAQITNAALRGGRFLVADDIRDGRRVCVLSAGVCDRLFPAGNFLGGQVVVNRAVFSIVGALADRELPSGVQSAHDDGAIYIPISTSQNLFGNYSFQRLLAAYDRRYEDKWENRAFKERVAALLAWRKGASYRLITTNDRTAGYRKIIIIIAALLGAAALLVLAAAGFGLIGASLPSLPPPAEPAARGGLDFLRSAHFYAAALAGLAGICMGTAAARLVTIFSGLPTNLQARTFLAAPGAVLTVGLAGCLYRHVIGRRTAEMGKTR